MTRSFLVAMCLLLLFVGMIASGLELASASRPIRSAPHSSFLAPFPSGGPPSGRDSQATAKNDPFSIDIGGLADFLRKRPKKEVDDQLLDWAVYGTLLHFGVDEDTLSKATHRTTPFRLPYLEEFFEFDYGRGRRIILGDNNILLFYVKNDPDPTATLGRLADQVRTELGETPGVFQVFEASPDLSMGEILINRKPDIGAREIFGTDFGYHERTVANLNEFQSWLAEIDDLSYIHLDHDAVLLGGRRFPRSRTRNIDLQDVAALYQAHVGLSEGRAPFRPSRDYASPVSPRRLAAINRESVPSSPGFSLDPQWDLEGLEGALEALADNPCSIFPEIAKVDSEFVAAARAGRADSTALPIMFWRDIRIRNSLEAREGEQQNSFRHTCESLKDQYRPRVQQALAQIRMTHDAVPFLRLKQELEDAGRSDLDAQFMFSLVNFLFARYQVQCARYDGHLQGTHVGMVLFYTDLLAKLWQAVDYHFSAPSSSVPGFLSSPRLNIEPAFEDEVRRFPYTRIWFGPKAEAFSFSKDDAKLWFNHIGTRVYSAGSDPLQPGQETVPAEHSRRTIGWWDRHYAEVADYEQEYHLQNQIMKWSVATGWLLAKAVGSYLVNVEVDHSLRFDRWHKANAPRLRYRYDIALLPESEWRAGTECLEQLASRPFLSYGTAIYFIEGGVSLAGREALEMAPRINTALPRLGRFTTILEEEIPGRMAGAASRARPRYTGPGTVLIHPTEATRARVGPAQLLLGDLNTTFTRGRIVQTMRPGGSQNPIEVGIFSGRPVREGTRLAWQPSDLEWARGQLGHATTDLSGFRPADWLGHSDLIAGQISRARIPGSIVLPDERALLLPRPDARAALKIDMGVFPPQEANVALVKNVIWKSNNAVGAKANLIRASEVDVLIDRYEWVRLSPEPGSEGFNVSRAVSRAFTHESPPAAARQVALGGIDGYPEGLKVWAGNDGIWVPRPTSPSGPGTWGRLESRLVITPRGVRQIMAGAKAGESRLAIGGELYSPRIDRAVSSLENGRFTGALDEITGSTAREASSVGDNLGRIKSAALEDADYHLVSGNAADARNLYSLVTDFYGDASPEILLRQGLAELKTGQPGRGLATLQEAIRKGGGKVTGESRALIEKALAPDGDFYASDMKQAVESILDIEGHGAARAAEVLFVPDGTEVASACKLQRPLKGTLLKHPERARLTGPEAENVALYIDDSFSLNKVDFEATGSGFLSEVARSPLVRWREVQSLPTGSYRPTLLLDEGRGLTYRKMSDTSTAAGRASQGLKIPARSARILLIQNCDRDHDGSLSDAEEKACA